MTELKAASGFNRRSIVEKAEWRTPLGSDQPVCELGQLSEQALATF